MWRLWYLPAILEGEQGSIGALRMSLPKSGATAPVDRMELLLLADIAVEQLSNESDSTERLWYRFDEKERPEVIDQWAMERLFAEWP